MQISFDSFNARNLRAQDVAERFVQSDDFDRVCKNNHTIILGPRGSGKTTLLKMLTLPAIQIWRHLGHLDFSLPFSAIYIPTDIVWHHQLLFPEELISLTDGFYQRISHGAVCTASATAAVETFMDMIRLMFPERKGQETDLAATLIKTWGLKQTIPKLSHVYLGLKSRMLELGTYLNRRVAMKQSQAGDELPDWCDIGFAESLDFAVNAFDQIFERDRESRWAVCFDELELAPHWLQELLFRLSRSTAQKLLFKLSSSPDPDIFSLKHVTPSDDVDLVKLWRASMVQRRSFCRELAVSVMNRKGLANITPEEFLGHSDENEVEPIDGERLAKPYEQGSDEWDLIKNVASWDKSLATLLKRKGINPSNPTVSVPWVSAILYCESLNLWRHYEANLLRSVRMED